MLEAQQAVVNTTRNAERRAHSRLLCTPLAFVCQDNFNGGIAYNISKYGMALSAANVLAGQVLDLRVQLPPSHEWIQLSGEIMWKSKSEKEAGLRFVGLTPEAREQIGLWIALETSPRELHRETIATQTGQETRATRAYAINVPRADSETNVRQNSRAGTALERMRNWIFWESRGERRQRDTAAVQHTALDTYQRTKDSIFAQAEPAEPLPHTEAPRQSQRASSTGAIEKHSNELLARPRVAVEERIEILALSTTASAPQWAPKGAATQMPKDGRQTGANPISAHAPSSASERRAHARVRMVSLGYVQLGQTSGGIGLNISEGGIALTTAEVLRSDHLPSMRIQFPGSKAWIETGGQVCWRSKSKKEAGVRFVGLTEEARRQVTSWISDQSSPGTVRDEVAGISEQQGGRAATQNDRESTD